MVRCDICGKRLEKGEGNVYMQYGVTPKLVCKQCLSMLSRPKENKFKNYLKTHMNVNRLLPKIILTTIVLLVLLSLFILFFIQTNSILSEVELIEIVVIVAILILFIVWGWIVFFLSRRIIAQSS